MPRDLPSTYFNSFRRKLLAWYDQNHRDLPWRQTNDPYKIWVSEIMLQQTQVATVIDYYHRFLKRFPTVQSLAQADIEAVLQLWSGLGYYRRARSLHRAAVQIIDEFSGKFPETVQQIQSLHGVGRYTAGAVASFAYDSYAPILEANTIRLHARLLGIQEPVKSTESTKPLMEFAESILPLKSGSGHVLNQAVMELGSQICTPQNPICMKCPVKSHCKVHEKGLENSIPVITAKPKPIPMTHVGVIIFDKKNRILLRKNRAGQWWEGLWDLPWVEVDHFKSNKQDDQAYRNLEQQLVSVYNLDCRITQLHRVVRHTVTKYKIEYHCLRGTLSRTFKLPKSEAMDWFTLAELPPVSSRFNKIELEKPLTKT
ncbi:MAG: A/G-specific adenine glycosylase [Pirellulales bacterium]